MYVTMIKVVLNLALVSVGGRCKPFRTKGLDCSVHDSSICADKSKSSRMYSICPNQAMKLHSSSSDAR